MLEAAASQTKALVWNPSTRDYLPDGNKVDALRRADLAIVNGDRPKSKEAKQIPMSPKTAAQPASVPHAHRGVVLYFRDAIGDAAATRAQAQRHFRGVRRPWRFRRHAGRCRRTVLPGHTVPFAPRTAGERWSAAAPWLEPARRQCRAGRRPDQPGRLRRSANRPAKGYRAYPAHDFPMAEYGVSAARRAQLRRSDNRTAIVDPVRQRFRRSVRSARHASPAPRDARPRSYAAAIRCC